MRSKESLAWTLSVIPLPRVADTLRLNFLRWYTSTPACKWHTYYSQISNQGLSPYNFIALNDYSFILFISVLSNIQGAFNFAHFYKYFVSVATLSNSRAPQTEEFYPQRLLFLWIHIFHTWWTALIFQTWKCVRFDLFTMLVNPQPMVFHETLRMWKWDTASQKLH